MSRGLSRQQVAILLAMRHREERDCARLRPAVGAKLDDRRDRDTVREHERYGVCRECVTTVGNLYEALCQTASPDRLRQTGEVFAESTPAAAARWISSTNCYAERPKRTRLVSIDRALRSLERRGWVQRLGIYKNRGYSDGKGRWVLAWATHWHTGLQSSVARQAQTSSIDAARHRHSQRKVNGGF